MCDLLDNFIGIRGCSQTAPGSGIYVNDVPGVSSQLAAKIADAEDVSGQNLLQRCVEQAYTGGMLDVIARIAEAGHVFMPQRGEYGQDAVPIDDSYLEAGDEKVLKIYPATPYEDVTIERISVWSEGAGNLTWSITGDDALGDGTTVALAAGAETTIEINYSGRAKVELTLSADVRLKYYTSSDCRCTMGVRMPARVWISSVYDLCLLAYNYRHTLVNVFQGKAAVNFLQEVSVNPRTGRDSRAAPTIASQGLRYLMGGTDPDTGVYIPGTYTGAVKAAAKALVFEIRKGAVPGFECSGIGYHEMTP